MAHHPLYLLARESLLGVLLEDLVDDVHPGISVALLIHATPGDHVGGILEDPTEVGEGHHVGKLREERGVLYDDSEEEELVDEVLRPAQMLVRELELTAKDGYL